MVDFFLNLITLFGGVFGALIGFLLIAGTAVLLGLPYILFTRRSQEPQRRGAREGGERY